MYSESGCRKHANRKIFIIKSRIESSSEKDLNQLEVWKKDKRYHVFKMPFHEKMAESGRVAELKKDGLYWYVSFVLHTSIIGKD